MAKDSDFAEQAQAARDAALAAIEERIHRLCTEGGERPLFSRGQLVGTERTFDSKLLLAAAGRLNPEWRPVQRTELSGKVEVESKAMNLTLSLADLKLLAESEREVLISLIDTVAQRRATNHGPETVCDPI